MDFASIKRKISSIVRHPLISLGVALTLIFSSAAEVIEPFLSGEAVASLGAEHGLLIFGLAHGLKSLLELFEGVEKLGTVSAPKDE